MNNKVWIVIDNHPEFGNIYGIYTNETLANQAKELLNTIEEYDHYISVEEHSIDTNIDCLSEFIEDNFNN